MVLPSVYHKAVYCMKPFRLSCFVTSRLLCSPLSFADWINTAVEKNEAQTIQLRHHIHQHPELGNMKFQTSKLMQQQLKFYGIGVKAGFAKTGGIGIFKCIMLSRLSTHSL